MPEARSFDHPPGRKFKSAHWHWLPTPSALRWILLRNDGHEIRQIQNQAANVFDLDVLVLHEAAEDPAGAGLAAAANLILENRLVARKEFSVDAQDRLAGTKLTGKIPGSTAAFGELDNRVLKLQHLGFRF